MKLKIKFNLKIFKFIVIILILVIFAYFLKEYLAFKIKMPFNYEL